MDMISKWRAKPKITLYLIDYLLFTNEYFSLVKIIRLL